MMMLPATLPEPSTPEPEESAPAPPVRPAAKGLLAHIADARRERLATARDPYRRWSMAVGLVSAIAFAYVFIVPASPRYGVTTPYAYGCEDKKAINDLRTVRGQDAFLERFQRGRCVRIPETRVTIQRQDASGMWLARAPGHLALWFAKGFIDPEE
jgi:hypothetical protein